MKSDSGPARYTLTLYCDQFAVRTIILVVHINFSYPNIVCFTEHRLVHN